MTDIKKEFLEGLTVLLDKCFGADKKDITQIPITKSLDEEKRIALFVVLEPQEGEYTTDLHGDTYTAEEVEKASMSFNIHCMKANKFHQVETEDAKILESYISPVEMNIDGKLIKEGTWLQKWYFPETEEGQKLWDGVKSGKYNGLSIQGKAKPENIDD